VLQAGMTLAWAAPAWDGGSSVVRYFVKGRMEQRGPCKKSKVDDGYDETDPTVESGLCISQSEVLAGEDRLEFQTLDASTRLTITGLRGNTWYVFWVHALTSVGLSPPSPASAFLLTGAVSPGRPRNLVLAEAQQTELALTWQKPLDD
ncbi:unnamed protein product, partial [Polarella glacialis]